MKMISFSLKTIFTIEQYYSSVIALCSLSTIFMKIYAYRATLITRDSGLMIRKIRERYKKYTCYMALTRSSVKKCTKSTILFNL